MLLVGVSGPTDLALAVKKTEKVDLSSVQERARSKTKKAERGKTRITRNEAFLMATETRLLKEIQKAIAYLSRTASRMPKKSTARLEMREKLINLRLEAAVYHASQEMRTYDKAWEAWDLGGRRGREPKLSDARSKGQWRILAKGCSDPATGVSSK